VSDDVVENESVASSSDDATEAFDPRGEAERQRDEYLDALQRLQAEFENYRKRVVRSSEDAATRSTGQMVAKLLPVLDAFDLAQAHFVTSPGSEADALDQARRLMLDTLQREGLGRIDAVDVAFDPHVHDAVAHVESDEASDGPRVVEVLRAGYRWKGVVLRPAMVKVRG
jgi:molecular chaperone GrpE